MLEHRRFNNYILITDQFRMYVCTELIMKSGTVTLVKFDIIKILYDYSPQYYIT